MLGSMADQSVHVAGCEVKRGYFTLYKMAAFT